MRVALVAGPAAGHAFPMIALGCRLQRAGHAVAVATGTQWRSGIEAEGMHFVDLPLLKPSPMDGDFGYRMWGLPVGMAPPLVDRLAPWRPDALVSDVITTVGGFCAGLMGIPWAQLIPHPLQDVSVALPPPGTGLAPGVTPEELQRDAYLRRKHLESARNGDDQRRAARRALGLPPDGPPAVRLVATLPALELPRPDWPADAVVVGPMEWDPSTVSMHLPPGDAPVVALSASTMSDVGPGLLEVALEALDGLDVRLACTRLEPFSGAVPSWASVGPGRQDAVISAARLLVSGAGHGIIAKALVRGKPLVVVPGEGEQRDNANRLARLGVGEFVEAFDLAPSTLREAVRKVLASGEDGPYDRAAAAAAATLADTANPVTTLEHHLA